MELDMAYWYRRLATPPADRVLILVVCMDAPASAAPLSHILCDPDVEARLAHWNAEGAREQYPKQQGTWTWLLTLTVPSASTLSVRHVRDMWTQAATTAAGRLHVGRQLGAQLQCAVAVNAAVADRLPPAATATTTTTVRSFRTATPITASPAGPPPPPPRSRQFARCTQLHIDRAWSASV